MKKILFSLLLVAAMSANAQTFDEVNLIGTWKLESFYGKLPYGLKTFDSIVLGETVRGTSTPCSGFIKGIVFGSGEYRDEKHIPDFFISNNNKLHIIVGDDFSLRFIIEELTATTMKVRTYDGKCSVTFTMKNPTDIKAVQKNSENTDTYNLGGQKVKNVTSDGVYIQNGQKKVVKK